MIGPTFVISSYSRIRRRQAPRSMSSARNPKFLADGPFESLGGGPGLVDVREACLREVRLPPSLTAEFRRDRLEDLGGVHGDVGAARDDETHIVRRLGPEDRGRPGLRSDRLGHRHHKPDPFRHLLFHEGPGHPRRLDGLPGFRRRLLVRRPLREFPQLLPLGHDSFGGGDKLVRGNSASVRASRCVMSSRAMSAALCAPACQTWFPRTLRAAPSTMWVAVWFRINASRRFASMTQATRFPFRRPASPRTKCRTLGPVRWTS